MIYMYVQRGIAALMLLVLLPFLGVLGLSIVINLGWPGVFTQKRVGLQGRLFSIYKFRTMRFKDRYAPAVLQAERTSTWTRWIRRHKWDELLQLWNIFRGDMAFVGPRPQVPEYIARYTQKDQDIILSVRPGLTDFASIQFFAEEDMLRHSLEPEKEYWEKIWPQKRRYILFYVQHKSLWLDIKILIQTLGCWKKMSLIDKEPKKKGQ